MRKTTVFPGKSRRFPKDSFSFRTVCVVRGAAGVSSLGDVRQIGPGQGLLLEDGRDWLIENAGDDLLVVFEMLSRKE